MKESADQPRARALAYLATHHVATLATHGHEGPWASAVFYVNLGFDLVFLSSPRSRHMLNVAANALASAAIQEDYADWRQIKGVQLEGSVRLLSGEEAADARRMFKTKFPIVRTDETTPAAIAAALDKASWYRLVSRRAIFIDNSERFGHRDQVL